MKRNVLFVCLGLMSLFVFVACLGDNEEVYVSYGVIRNVNSSNDYEILTDKGNTLKVSKSYTDQTVENDKRVLVNFEVLSDKDRNKHIYEVQVNGFYNLLSKDVVYESFIVEDEQVRRDSIGNDPFINIAAAFGGNYINIDFSLYYKYNSDVKHLINLVYDDTQATADTIYLTLYHNAYGEVPGNNLNLRDGVGRSSFLISDLLPQGVTSKPVKLTWTEYNNHNEPVVRSKSRTFKLDDTSDEDGRIARQTGIDSSLEIR